MVITIDGPAGAGKSSAARELAARLGFHFLDTGAMYRAVALAAMQRGIPWDDAGELADLVRSLDIVVSDDRVYTDGVDVTDEIRRIEVTAVIHHVADNPEIRSHLVEQQRRVAASGDYVTEGRDQGTVAFPQADCKIFLTASAEERARRRMKELDARGEEHEFDAVLAQQNQRDRRDCTRSVGRLVAAQDAVVISTDNRSLSEVVDVLEQLARAHCQLSPRSVDVK